MFRLVQQDSGFRFRGATFNTFDWKNAYIASSNIKYNDDIEGEIFKVKSNHYPYDTEPMPVIGDSYYASGFEAAAADDVPRAPERPTLQSAFQPSAEDTGRSSTGQSLQ